jgi:hypothetical protein
MLINRFLCGATVVMMAVMVLTGGSFATGQEFYSYAVVIGSEAYHDAGWRLVADSLVKKHAPSGDARLFTWEGRVSSCKEELAEYKPDYIGFVARPVSDCNSGFVAQVSRMCRDLDDDPYGDAVWGIITGYESADALRAISESLSIKTVLAASNGLPDEPPLQRYYQAVGMPCESYTTTQYIFPGTSGEVHTEDRRPNGETDRIRLVADWLNASSLDLSISGKGELSTPVDCIITGGHGNVNVWQCHYPEAGSEGYMQSSGGQLYGAPYSGGSIEINCPAPKVLWCASNCLMGNPDRKDNIVYAAFHSGHALQMFGFVNNASGGDEFMAWGMYDRVTKFAGRYTLPQGFYYARNMAQFELQHPAGHFTTSLVALFMDSTVIYGDPAADVTFHDFGDDAKAYDEDLTVEQDAVGENARFTYTITARAHNIEFGKGYCYQFRPIRLLPVRINPATVVIEDNHGGTADINDNMVVWEMLSNGETLSRGDSRSLVWTADVTDRKSVSQRTRRQIVSFNKRSVTVTSVPGGIHLKASGFSTGAGICRVVDACGRCRAQTRMHLTGATTDRRMDLPDVSGVYHVIVEGNHEREIRRLSLIR